VPIEKCTDSDNGLDYFTKGKVSGPLSSDPSSPREDMCLGDTTLREMFCNSAGKGEPRLYDCTSGCKDGVCLKETPASICAMGGGFSCLDTNFDAQRNRVAIQVKNNLGYSARISEVKLSPGTSCQNENPVQKIDHVLGNGEVGLFLINCNAKGDIKESIQIIYTNVETGITHIASGKLYIKGSSTGPTCYDGIWNDGESGVDCGGSCKPCEETTCASGCMRNGKCLPFGTRVVEDNKALYCSIDGKFSMQKVENAECQNSYECETNTCSSAKCVDINRKLDEQQSTMQKILKWFSRIFGKE
jgi:hypothetical protein